MENIDLHMPMNSLFRVNETGKILGESIADKTFLTHRQRAIKALVNFLEANDVIYKDLPSE